MVAPFDQITLIEGPDGVELSAKKILTALAHPHEIGGHDLHITFGIGIAINPAAGPKTVA